MQLNIKNDKSGKVKSVQEDVFNFKLWISFQ